MLNAERLESLAQMVDGAGANTLRTKKSRKEFAKAIADGLNLWEPNVQSFVSEMDGLNFFNAEDKLLFLQLAQAGL